MLVCVLKWSGGPLQMRSVVRAKSLPVMSSSQPEVCCCMPLPGNSASDHLLRERRTSRGHDDEVVPDCCILKPFSPSHSQAAACSEAEKQQSCHHMDTGRDNRCNSLSSESDARRRSAGREEAVIASEDPDKKGSRQLRVSAETEAAVQQQHRLRQQQLFSFLAATAAVTVARPEPGSDLLSSRNKRMSLTASDESSSSSAESHPQMPETSSSAASSPDDLTDADFEELYFPDNLILKELSEMRQILQKLLEQNKELSLITFPLVADEDILSAVLGLRSADAAETSSHSSSSTSLMSTDSASSPNPCITSDPSPEPSPHFPVGSYDLCECNICFSSKWMYRRACCSFPACAECLMSYYASRVDLGQVSIECVNSLCRCFVHRDEISLLLPASKKSIYCTLLANSNSDDLSKTCPRCNHVMKLESVSILKSMERASRKNPAAVQVLCRQCSYCWCFPCASPWHEGISCRQYLKGDRLLQDWAKQVSQGQVNAQKCPKCKILIQKSSGCDHMHCPRCKTDFCYRCGDSLRRLKFFGDHYSKLSVFGCKYRYKAGQPVQRKLIRGAVFASKLMMAPVLGSLALVAGAVVVGVGVAALPLYGGIRLYRKYQHIALNRSPFQVSSLDSGSGVIPHTRDTVSTAAQTVRITFMGDNYVDEIDHPSVP